MSADGVDLIIRNGTLVAPEGRYAAAIAIRQGVIAAIGEERLLPPAREIIDADGLFVLPGVIDAHVHFRDPGNTDDEDWETGSAAAACGGVTTVFDMPSTNPPVDNVANLKIKESIARAKSHIDFGLYGLLGAHNLTELEALSANGVVGFKCFMSSSLSGRLPAPDDGVILEGFERIARLGRRCIVHAENLGVVTLRERRLKEAGRVDGRAHAESRPPVAAAEAVSRAIIFAESAKMRLHIAHESSADALPYIAAARARGVDVTAETCPQYLLLTDDDVATKGGILRCNPPIRKPGHDAALWKAINDNVIDILTTDHAPHSISHKTKPNIWDNSCGLLGVETSLPVMLTQVHRGLLSLERLVSLCSASPARVWDLYPRKGALRVGSDADIVLVDMERSTKIDQEKLHSKHRISGWHGRAVKGFPVRTIVRGRTVMLSGDIVGPPGWGRPVQQSGHLNRQNSAYVSAAGGVQLMEG
jgi:dihydroorotase